MISGKPLPSDNRPATPQRGAVARPATPQRGTVARAAAGGQARHRLSPSSLRRRLLRMPCKTCQVQLQPAKVSAEPSVGRCHSETSAKSSNGFASARSQYKLFHARSTRFNSASGQEEQTWKGCWRAAFAELMGLPVKLRCHHLMQILRNEATCRSSDRTRGDSAVQVLPLSSPYLMPHICADLP